MRKAIFIICSVLLVACGKNTPPENLLSEPFYKQGIKAFDADNFSSAKVAFLQSVKRGRNYATFLPLAQIYDKEKDYEMAIFYYRQYLFFLPKDDVNKPAILVMLENSRKELRNFKTDEEKENLDSLKKQLAKIREENRLLQNRILARSLVATDPVLPKNATTMVLPQTTPGTAVISQVVKSLPPLPVTQSIYIAEYIVQKGDNLSSISVKYYKTSKYWEKILFANKDILQSESKLQVGQKLKIPKL